jgi:hypothetical protein
MNVDRLPTCMNEPEEAENGNKTILLVFFSEVSDCKKKTKMKVLAMR